MFRFYASIVEAFAVDVEFQGSVARGTKERFVNRLCR